MKSVSEILASAPRPFPSIELVPPQRGITRSELIESLRPLMAFKPPFVNVTHHRDEYEFIPLPDGTFRRRTVRNRISSTAVCAALQAAFDVEVVPHVICAGTSADLIEAQLQDFRFLGISNLMALRGDSLVGEKRFVPDPDGYRYASELVSAVRASGRSAGKDFCIGVGAYPEKHFEAANPEEDLRNLKKKVDAGADYIITQMFFDNAVFYRFRDRIRSAGITVPVIPGLKPLSSARQLDLLPQTFSIDIPQELAAEVRAHAADPAACYEAGRRWCEAQCRDLLQHGVPAVHFFTMGRSDNVISVLKACF